MNIIHYYSLLFIRVLNRHGPARRRGDDERRLGSLAGRDEQPREQVLAREVHEPRGRRAAERERVHRRAQPGPARQQVDEVGREDLR